jgi:hypothetical protein
MAKRNVVGYGLNCYYGCEGPVFMGKTLEDAAYKALKYALGKEKYENHLSLLPMKWDEEYGSAVFIEEPAENAVQHIKAVQNALHKLHTGFVGRFLKEVAVRNSYHLNSSKWFVQRLAIMTCYRGEGDNAELTIHTIGGSIEEV